MHGRMRHCRTPDPSWDSLSMRRPPLARLFAEARQRSSATAAAAPPALRWALLGVLVLSCGAFLFSAPQPWRLLDTPAGLSAAAAVVGWLGRRRLADALVLALPPLAGRWVDPELGAQALLAACLLPYLATKRPRFAAVAGSAAVALLLAGVWLKQRFAGTALTWQDVRFFFRQFGDNVGVLATQPTLLLYAGLALGLAALGCLAAWRWDRPGRRGADAGAVTAAALAGLLLAHSAGLVAQSVRTLRDSGAWFVAEGLLERPLLGFFATVSLAPQWTIPPTDTTDFRHDSQALVSAATAERPADIVVFLQESQFNPETLAGCAPTLCRMEAFGAGPDTIAHGPLQVHTFGGGTWLSEFSLQTGVPHDAFGPAGEFASFSLAPHVRRSFVRSLKAAGYRTVALYATRGGMMNGRVAYAGYGFDEFLDAAELDLPGAWDTPDALVHEAARRVLARERRDDRPVFMFVQTIFNHAEHGVRMERVPAGLLSAAARQFASTEEARSVADYLWRSRAFERELLLTRHAVLDTARPAVLAWFGDHQPPFSNAVTLRERVRPVPTASGAVPARYQTWYEVSSNRPGRLRREPPDALDLVFLPSLLAQAAGARMDEWLAANQLARTRCAALLEACRTPGTREAYLSYLRDDLGEFERP